LNYLKQRQLNETAGWNVDDREYGGWGYCHGLPLKPKPGELRPPMTESNLSATTFALAALTAAGVPADDPAYGKALTFVKRCQNWSDREATNFDDGGFFFIYDDPIRNKSGVAGNDKDGRDRYHSYGSVTADGIRCLDMCGEAKESPRQKAAAAWLRKNFKADQCPGPFGERLEARRAAVYFYYAMSMAQTPLEQWLVDEKPVRRVWKEALAEAVIGRQNTDGSWANEAEAFRENDPVVATAFASIAIANCRGPLKVVLPG
jgi:squalene-hopene/tetraprenyl-beta-curcumene cyclase